MKRWWFALGLGMVLLFCTACSQQTGTLDSSEYRAEETDGEGTRGELSSDETAESENQETESENQETESESQESEDPSADLAVLPDKKKGVKRERFEKLVDQVVAETNGLMNLKVAAQVENEAWFADYNGEKAQRLISKDGAVYTPMGCNDVIYYRADEDESLDEVVAAMKKMLLEPLTEPTDGRTYTVAEYSVDGQTLITGAELIRQMKEQLWRYWCEKDGWTGEKSAEEMIARYIPQTGGRNVYLRQNMWLLPELEGYYRYTGEVDKKTMEQRLETENQVDGMIPITRGQNQKENYFILVKDGNVYRLQRMNTMKTMFSKEASPYFDRKGGWNRQEFMEVLRQVYEENPEFLQLNCMQKMERADWFAQYNGEKTQRITSWEGDSFIYAICNDAVFYRADEGETIEEIVVKLKELMMKPLTEPNEKRGYTVTDYDLSAQTIKTGDELWEEVCGMVWEHWIPDDIQMTEAELKEYLKKQIPQMAVCDQNLYVKSVYMEEDMWLLPAIEGTYSYTYEMGSDIGGLLARDKTVVNIQTPYGKYTYRAVERYQSEFVVLKYGDVYRMQRIFGMQIYGWEILDQRGLNGDGQETAPPLPDDEPESDGSKASVKGGISRERFDELVDQVCSESPEILDSKLLLEKDIDDWYLDYNGEKLQRIDREWSEYYQYTAADSIVYYRADPGESLEQIVENMKIALLKPQTIPSETRRYLVLKYDLSEQELITGEQLDRDRKDKLWENWYAKGDSVSEEDALKYIRGNIGWVYRYSRKVILRENMWLLPTLEGKGRYIGRGNSIDMEEALAQLGMVTDMVDFTYSHVNGIAEENREFLLIKNGDVYRLQRLINLKWEDPEYARTHANAG